MNSNLPVYFLLGLVLIFFIVMIDQTSTISKLRKECSGMSAEGIIAEKVIEKMNAINSGYSEEIIVTPGDNNETIEDTMRRVIEEQNEIEQLKNDMSSNVVDDLFLLEDEE